jgi:hypothetical protein
MSNCTADEAPAGAQGETTPINREPYVALLLQESYCCSRIPFPPANAQDVRIWEAGKARRGYVRWNAVHGSP